MRKILAGYVVRKGDNTWSVIFFCYIFHCGSILEFIIIIIISIIYYDDDNILLLLLLLIYARVRWKSIRFQFDCNLITI